MHALYRSLGALEMVLRIDAESMRDAHVPVVETEPLHVHGIREIEPVGDIVPYPHLPAPPDFRLKRPFRSA